MVKKTYKELLEGLKYSDLGYTGERKPLTDPKYKQFTDTINKNTAIANTHIDSSLPAQMPQAQVSGQWTTPPTADVKNPWKNRRNTGVQDPKAAEESTVGNETTVGGAVPTETPLTIDAKYSDFVNWAKQNGVDSDKVFQDAMALARSQYEQSRATYGLQAEQLAQAGLTNSGVSDNLERAAYAQKVQAEQAALGQKAALDQANKQGFAEYQEQQKQQQQQYTNLYQQLVDGYKDEYDNFHAGVSPEMAIAQLKFAGLTDESMIAEAQKAYAAYKSVYDQQQADQQNAIAGIDSTKGSFSADSIFGKLFSGDMKEQEFFDTINQQYGIATDSYDEAIEALVQNKTITREQANMFYRESLNNTIKAIVSSHQSAGDILKKEDNDLYNMIDQARKAYEEGKISEDDWNAFRSGILTGKDDIGIKFSYMPSPEGVAVKSDTITFKLKVGNTEQEINVLNGPNRRTSISKEKAEHLDAISNGMDCVYEDGKLYIKANAGFSKKVWIRVGVVSGTKKNNIVEMLKLLFEPTQSSKNKTDESQSQGRSGGR